MTFQYIDVSKWINLYNECLLFIIECVTIFFSLCTCIWLIPVFFFFLLRRKISRFADETLPQFDNLDPGRLSHVCSMTSKGAMLENLIYRNSKECMYSCMYVCITI